MRKGTLFLSILLAVAVSTTADAAKKKRHYHHMAAASAAPASKISGYGWAGTPYQTVSETERGAFWRDAINPMGAK